MLNWQLSKQDSHWPVSHDHMAGSCVNSSRWHDLFGSWPKFIFCVKCRWNVLCLCAAQLKFWLQTDLGRENSASYYRKGRQLLLTFLTMVTRCSRSTFNFYALIGQNLTGEFMRKICAASWILFTLTAEADRVFCQLVIFLSFFFHWMYKMKFRFYQESSVIHG